MKTEALTRMLNQFVHEKVQTSVITYPAQNFFNGELCTIVTTFPKMLDMFSRFWLRDARLTGNLNFVSGTMEYRQPSDDFVINSRVDLKSQIGNIIEDGATDVSDTSYSVCLPRDSNSQVGELDFPRIETRHFFNGIGGILVSYKADYDRTDRTSHITFKMQDDAQIRAIEITGYAKDVLDVRCVVKGSVVAHTLVVTNRRIFIVLAQAAAEVIVSVLRGATKWDGSHHNRDRFNNELIRCSSTWSTSLQLEGNQMLERIKMMTDLPAAERP